METIPVAKPKRTRCPDGTRKNKKGDCVPVSKPPIKIQSSTEVSPKDSSEIPPSKVPPSEVPVIPVYESDPPKNRTVKHRTKYCPKGSRRNRKGQCVNDQGVVVSENDGVVPEIDTNQGTSSVEGTDKEPLKEPETAPAEMVEPETRKLRKSGWNAFLAEKEKMEYSRSRTNDSYDFLYPELNDPFFNAKIASRKEFSETEFDGTVYDIAKQSNFLCSAPFEPLPHQRFVRNFLSAQTPYNGLLLYHGLGTGKTCSAIGVAEEMRRYMQQVGLRDKILVIASPNVQGNFRTQLFDETKLVQVPNPNNSDEYTWNIESCVGDSLLREIDPNTVRNMPREKIITNIQTIINTWYEFMGYGQLANYIVNQTKVSEKSGYSDAERRTIELKKIRETFNNRFLIIDEVHNVSQTGNNKHETTGALLMQVVKYATNMRLLLLSATPMFDSYKEIVWLTNLLNTNDKRSTIDVSDVFDSDGNFREISEKERAEKKEGGRELLERKLTGYVSYVRGENPYTFPFRIYPDTFAPEHSVIVPYPTIQINDLPVPAPLKYIRTYSNLIPANSYPFLAYKFIVSVLKSSAQAQLQEINSFDMLQKPLECLNIVYPNAQFERAIQPQTTTDRAQYATGLATVAIGENGLRGVITYQDKGHPLKHNFDYLPGVVEKYGRVFSPPVLAKYSPKMASVCDAIRRSEGIVMVYSQYIDGGVVPLALALEEMGFAKFGTSQQTKSLWKKPPVEAVDATTMKPRSHVQDFQQATYIMITGDKMYSPNNTADIAYAKHKDNRDGSRVKVILISKAGSEGIDFKHIRQIHILEPWFNMNRIEQIIGRGVRNLSHCALPFEKRNVQIYLHSSRFEGDDEEPVDLYVYRLAERKSVQIGKITRLLKTTSVDCRLNVGQTNMTPEKLAEITANQQVGIHLSTGERVRIRVGDQPGTDICDYMDTCEYKCSDKGQSEKGQIVATYTPDVAETNIQSISKRIRQLYREHTVYKRDQLIRAISIRSTYPIEHVFQALSKFLRNGSEWLVDKYGRMGRLTNRGEYYSFQPMEIGDESATTFERTVPVEYKRERITLEVPKEMRRTEEVAQPTEMPMPALPAKTISGSQLIERVMENHAITERPIETKGLDKNWYRNCSTVVDILTTEYGIPKEQITRYVVAHTLDEMAFDEKMVLVRHFYRESGTPRTENRYEQMIVDYLEERRVSNAERNKQGILLANQTEVVLTVRSADNTAPEWVEGVESDFTYFKTKLAQKHIVPKQRLNRIVGYIVDFKNKEMIFKFKDITLTRNKLGARCDSAGKADIIKMLNMVLGSGDRYTQENTETLFQPKLCVILEILLREYTRISKNNRIYFLTPEQSILTEITRYTTSTTGI